MQTVRKLKERQETNNLAQTLTSRTWKKANIWVFGHEQRPQQLLE